MGDFGNFAVLGLSGKAQGSAGSGQRGIGVIGEEAVGGFVVDE